MWVFLKWPGFLWYWIKSSWYLLYGIWRIHRLPKNRVTFFGGARVRSDSKHAKCALELSRRCAERRISIITGGGGGIMEAVTCVAFKKTHTLGVGVVGLEEVDGPVSCKEDRIEMLTLSTRKWLLIQYSQAFVFFPGGIGTLNELTEVLTLIWIRELPVMPIVLFDKAYWSHLLEWVNAVPIAGGTVLKEQVSFLIVTDDIDEAFNAIVLGVAQKK